MVLDCIPASPSSSVVTPTSQINPLKSTPSSNDTSPRDTMPSDNITQITSQSKSKLPVIDAQKLIKSPTMSPHCKLKNIRFPNSSKSSPTGLSGSPRALRACIRQDNSSVKQRPVFKNPLSPKLSNRTPLSPRTSYMTPSSPKSAQFRTSRMAHFSPKLASKDLHFPPISPRLSRFSPSSPKSIHYNPLSPRLGHHSVTSRGCHGSPTMSPRSLGSRRGLSSLGDTLTPKGTPTRSVRAKCSSYVPSSPPPIKPALSIATLPANSTKKSPNRR